MFTDTSLLFSNAQLATGFTADSTVVDVTGAGAGNAPAMTNGTGNSIGIDIGAGDGAAIPSVFVNVGTTFTSGTSPTLTISIKAAPQTSSSVYTEGSYTTLFTSGAITLAQLVAGAQFNFPIPPIVLAEGEKLPRFYKLTYTISAGSFTAGTVTAGIVMSQPNLAEGSQFPRNFISLP